ncbi:TonB-dependent siderophore receptor [Pseudomonas paralcaligenes]|uniref:TonB-dependent siderophore receptor n=1 Tax=Pseudomonas paralcaligenes TaxID=2772558 RepID=UPI001C800475|nr:TonB-dependent siderophore receptor [Pseudomonas paralcaligenes]
MRHDQHHPLQPTRPLARAIRGAALGLLVVGTGLTAQPLLAEPADQQQVRHYHIPAGSLSAALAEFAGQAGITLPIDPALVEGKRSPGLDAATGIAEGMQRLLQGTGLRASPAGDGSWALYPAGDGTAVELGATNVNAGGLGATTEGSGAYTTGAMQTATRLPLSIRETPQSVTVVTRRQMDDQNLNSIASVLERSPGISLNHYESDRLNATARGFPITKIQYDGLSSLDDGFGYETDWQSDTAIYDRVEIVRGATGLMTGTGEPSAAINLVRKRPTADFQGHVQASAGSWDTYRGELDLSGPLVAEGNVRGRMVATHGDRHSYLDHYSKDQTGLYGILEADLAADMLFTVGLDYSTSHTNGATHGAPVPMYYSDGSRTHLSRSTTTAADWAYLDAERIASFASLEKTFANDWKARLQYTYRENEATPKLRYIDGFFDRTSGAGNLWVGGTYYDIDERQNAVDFSATGPFALLGREHELVLGYSYQDHVEHRRFHPRINTPPLNSFYDLPGYEGPEFGEWYRTDNPIDIKERQDAFYLASRWNLADALKLITGLRVSNVDYELTDWGITSKARYSSELTPYAGLVYDISEHYSAYVSYTDIFQTQTARDRNGALLEPVLGSNYEAGLKGEFYGGRLNLSAAAFLIKQDNLAEFDIIVNDEYRYKAVDGARIRGYELEASGEILPGWNMAGGFTRHIARGGDGQAIQTTEPQNMLRLTSSYRLSGALDRFTVGGHLSWQSRIYEKGRGPGGIDSEQDSYELVHLFGKYQVTDDISLQANINNLFDKTYYTGISYGYGRFGDPRNFNLTVRYDL